MTPWAKRKTRNVLTRSDISISVYNSQATCTSLLGNVVTGARSDCHHGQGRILIGTRDVTCPVCYKEVLDIVRLIELVEHGFLGIAAHPCRANFVNEDARRRRRPVTLANILSAGSLKHFCSGLAHVFDHRTLIVAEGYFDVQNRYAPE